ncbi:MAG TPA: SBBP repeat-containing protein, partial [Acidimicrobiales bacterium]|nr:SBBP repeat-containing protein [Acidimicrobiales bacterium]
MVGLLGLIVGSVGALVVLPRFVAPGPVPVGAASVRAAAMGSGVSGFEPNLGQGPSGSDFVARAGAYALSVAGGEANIALRGGGAVALRVVGAATVHAEGVDPLPGVVNDLTGTDPSQWHRNLPTFGTVAYRSLLPGVDLLFHSGAALEYDVVVGPGADPSMITLHVDGADRLRIDGRGDLVVATPAGTVTQHRPVVYQDVDGRRQPVAGRYVLEGRDDLRFAVGRYDRSRPLIIDPVVSFNSQLPGSGLQAGSIAVDARGASYVTGGLTSVSGAGRFGSGGGGDAFVAKLAPDGTTAYLTVLGGTGDDSGAGIAVDQSGRAYLTGSTQSTDFPTVNAFAPTHVCNGDVVPCTNGALSSHTAFVSVLDASGQNLAYSTYFGGNGPDAGVAVALDPAGGVYVAGQSSYQTEFSKTLFPTRNAFRAAPCNCAYQFGWAAKFDVSAGGGASLLYSTLIMHGADHESGTFVHGIAADASGSAYVVGEAGPGYPTTPAAFDHSTPPANARGGGFLTKLAPNGGSQVYSTLLGPTTGAAPRAVAVDQAGVAYVTGDAGPGFPTANPLQAQAKGTDAFVTAVSAGGGSLLYSSYLGGNGADSGRAIAVDSGGAVVVAGDTSSADFPVVNPIAGSAGTTGAFVAKLDLANQPAVMRYSTTLAGAGAGGVAIGPAGAVYVSRDPGTVLKLSSGPAVTSLSQAAGPTAGGAPITLAGAGLTGATSVSFGTVSVPCGATAACRPDAQNPDTALAVTVPAGMPGTVDVRVTTPDGTSESVAGDRFTYRAPVVSAIDVATGPATGGTVVHLTGTDLQGSTVKFGSAAATGVTASPDGTSVVATTPVNHAGAAAVGVSTPPGATAAAPSSFTYQPAITGILPPSGSLAGGDSIVIMGAGLSGATDVRFGADSAGAPIAAPGRDDQLVVPAIPAHAKPETVAVTLSAQGLDSVAVPAGANMFSYTTPPPPAKTPDPAAAAGGGGRDNGSPAPPAPPSGGGGTATNPGPGNAPAPAPAPGGGNAPAPAPAPANAPAANTPAPVNAPAGGG